MRKYEERQSIGDKEKTSGARVPTSMFYVAIILLKIAAMLARWADVLLLDTHHVEITCKPKQL